MVRAATWAGVGLTIKNATDMPTTEMSTPRRRDQAKAGSGSCWRMSKTASSRVTNHTNPMKVPIVIQTSELKGVVILKWLVVPRAA